MRIKLGYPLLVKQVAAYCGGALILSPSASCLQAVTHLTTDSREVLPGDLFVALETDKDDGHRYIKDAEKKGASVVLCRRDFHTFELLCCRITCRDTMTALTQLAARFASTVPHQTVAITGSVGKTTTRRYVSSVLSRAYRVHESPDNYNNLLGNCLLLLSMPRNTDVLVAECGMDGPGQIAALSSLLMPDYAIITNIGVSHIEKLGSREAICRAKLEITCGMNGGTLLCEGTDAYLRREAPRDTVFVSASHLASPYHCLQIQPDVHGVSFDFQFPNGRISELRIPSLGLHTLSCAAFAVALGVLFGMRNSDIRAGLSDYKEEKMRQSRIQAGTVTILFDAYNACPQSVQAVCEVMQLLSHDSQGSCHAVMGDMAELGAITVESHRRAGEALAQVGVKSMYAWGCHANDYANGALDAGLQKNDIRIFDADTPPSEIAAHLVGRLAPHDIILIKGSRCMEMERLLAPLKHEIEKKQL